MKTMQHSSVRNTHLDGAVPNHGDFEPFILRGLELRGSPHRSRGGYFLERRKQTIDLGMKSHLPDGRPDKYTETIRGILGEEQR